MTILCENCNKPVRRRERQVSAPISGPKQKLCTPRPFRSTKGASKARRDQINVELQTLRSLLPISEQEKEQLSYLHTMALVCFHIRETQLFNSGKRKIPKPLFAAAAIVDPELMHSLSGFILALTAKGKLAFVSENVPHFLGFSVVELLAQGNSIFDLLNSTASRIMQEKLLFAHQHPGTEIEFIVEMRTSRAFRVKYGRNRPIVMRGRFVPLDTQWTSASPALTFVAFCAPVPHVVEEGGNRSQISTFQSQHTLDMKIAEMTENVIYHLGYKKEELIGQSWYCLLHPEDTERGAEMHRNLRQSTGKHSHDVIIRLRCKDLSWVWVQVTALRENGKGKLITCTNHILRDKEALHIQSQDSTPRGVSPASSKRSYCSGNTLQPLKPNEANFIFQEPGPVREGALEYSSSQLPEASNVKMLPAPLQSPFPISLAVPSMKTEAVSVELSQETHFPFLSAEGHECLSCPEREDRLTSCNPGGLCSPEYTFSSDSSFSVDFSPLFAERPSLGLFPTMNVSPDSDRWAISMLADQIYSLAEVFSQYTKQRSQESLGVPWPGHPAEAAPLVARQDMGTNGAIDFSEETSVDEETITSILNNFSDHDAQNQSSFEQRPTGHFHLANTQLQLSMSQTLVPETTPLSFSVSSDFDLPDFQWDGKFYNMHQQGIRSEEAAPFS
ncbi:neuronal PAS domain-containing protein 4-like [Pseudonaja textilis]|uniref:neuronal PAS domain-containing protein 4-like n=1 Tax=Pseudonaja textilis TaxID=8673 RepID=UPI000EAA331B|nr:neuronal PAS domain-containing protein 4-like [Pseudonaja textilis]